MIDVAENIKQMKKELPQSVTLVAVSKFHPTEALMAAYDAGQRVFGESRAQELVQKAQENAYEGAPIHFIGVLQTNKVKQVVGHVDVIQSVDRLNLLEAIQKEAAKKPSRRKQPKRVSFRIFFWK